MKKLLQTHIVSRLLWCSLLAAVVTGAGRVIAQQDDPLITIRTVEEGARGTIQVMDLQGKRLRRIVGVRNPAAAFRMSDGRTVVYDVAGREVLSLLESGTGAVTVGRTWQMPEGSGEPVALYSATPESLFVVDRKGQTFTLSGDALVASSKPPAGVEALASGGAVLTDGRILVLRSPGEPLAQSLFTIRPDGAVWNPVAVSGNLRTSMQNPAGLAAAGSSIFLWRGGNENILYGTYSEGTLNVSGTFRYPDPALIVPTGSNDTFVITLFGKVARLDRNFISTAEYQFINVPAASVFDPRESALWLLHQSPQQREWPEWRNSVLHQQAQPFNWDLFWPIVSAAVVGAVVWALVAVRWGYEAPTIPRERIRREYAALSWRVVAAAVALLGIVGGGLFLAWRGQAQLLAGAERNSWLTPYLIGAILVAVATEAWRRWQPNCDEPERFATILKQPAPALGVAYLIPLVVIAALAAVLYSMGIAQQYNCGYREAVFCAGLVFVLSILLVDAWLCRAHIKARIAAEWPFFTVPLVVGMVTFFYRLEDLPYNTHFDFTLHAFVAEQFVRGVTNGWWEWGSVPAPVIGSIPEMLGFLIAGFSPFGYRLGSALFNLSAVFAVYLLGREYRNPRVGFWAALILAGNAIFVHFGRLMSNGSAATLALWAVVTAVLAISYKRSSLWLLAGVVSAATFYQWPVARVGAVAAALMYGVVALRFPIRYLRQLPHHIFGAAGVALLLAPLVTIWMVYPERLMPRAQESLTGLKISAATGSVEVLESTPQLFFRSLGWIFSEYDRSSQGSVSPGFNSVEAVLFACGLAILLLEGASLNIVLGCMLVVTLLVCGAWAVGPPWYTRVLPTAPIACVIIARTIENLHNVCSRARRSVFWGIFILLSMVVLYVSTWTNVERYYRYETAAVRRNNLQPHIAIGRAIDKAGPKHLYVMLVLGEPSWLFSDSSIGHLLPYISQRRLKECYDVRSELPVQPGESKAFVVQLKRQNIDIPVIQQFHPDATVTPIEDINRDRVAYMVVVDRQR